MKILTICIPCYNGEAYLKHAIESCFIVKEDIEIIIVDDGSTDQSRKIAKYYQTLYPDDIKVFEKENEGQGSAIEVGIEHAKGLYFKVLDNDDWFDRAALVKLIETIKAFIRIQVNLDMVICNYSYHLKHNKKKTIDFCKTLPTEKVFGWHQIKSFKRHQDFVLPALVYKTTILKKSNLQLPKHTRYIHHLLAYKPLVLVKAMFYLKVDLYHYNMDKEISSSNEKTMIEYKDHLYKVVNEMIDVVDISELKSRKQRNYMMKYLCMVMSLTSFICMKAGAPTLKDELWNHLKEKDENIYKSLMYSLTAKSMQVDNKYMNMIILKTIEWTRKYFD